MAAAQIEIKKPCSAYWLWLGDNRAKIAAIVGSKGSDVAKKGGEMWKVASAAEKAPFEKKAKEQKDAYEKLINTDAGKKALEEKKAASADVKAEKLKKEELKDQKIKEKEIKQNERACKAAVKSVEKDDALKKPQSAYWLWLGDNRAKIAAIVGNKGSDVAKKGGEMWKVASSAEKAPYEKKAKDQKDTYDKYIASAEGQAALKAFKDAVSGAKEEFKPKEEADAPAAVEEVAAGTKRKAKDATSTDKDTATDKGAVVKKARGRPPASVQKMAGA